MGALMHRLPTGKRISRALVVFSLCGTGLAATPADAHVKWFCSLADVTQPPLALSHVLSPLFGAIGCGFMALVFLGFMLDHQVAKRWPRLGSGRAVVPFAEERVVRIAVGAFFLLLWDKGAVVLWERGDAVLTPELTSSLEWMGPLQLAIAASMIWRRSCALGAAGIFVLYGFGVAKFGAFHMTDYAFFLGIAGYLLLTSCGAPVAGRIRVPLLTWGLAFSLMWTAIEKFVYPEWTFDIVADHPDLAFGFPWPFVVIVAGFVEFTLAFYIMTGRGLIRCGAAAYAAIFAAAIPEFGHLDTVGHLPILAILLVVCLRGTSPLQRLLRIDRFDIFCNAATVLALYVLTFIGLTGTYYAMQWAEFR